MNIPFFYIDKDECGIVCLQMALAYYGFRKDLEDLYIIGSGLSVIPESITKLDSLWRLDLSGNNFKKKFSKSQKEFFDSLEICNI